MGRAGLFPYLRFKSDGNNLHRSCHRIMDRGGYLEGWLMRWRGYHLREGKQTRRRRIQASPKTDRRSIWTQIFVSLKRQKREENSRDRSEVSQKRKKMETRWIQKLFQTVSTDRQTHRVAFPATFLLLPSPQASPLTEEPTCQSF